MIHVCMGKSCPHANLDSMCDLSLVMDGYGSLRNEVKGMSHDVSTLGK